jgi:hypothetical protein
VAIALRTYRFVGEGEIFFVVRECADRSTVLVSMEGCRKRREQCQLLLNAADWQLIRALDPFCSRATRKDAIAVELQFMDENEYGDSLTIARAQGSERVSVRMQCGAPDREELEMSTELSRRQWRYLTALDVVAQPCVQAPRADPGMNTHSPSRLLRMIHPPQRTIATESQSVKDV